MTIHSNKPPLGQVANWTAQSNQRISCIETGEKLVDDNKIDMADNVENPDDGRVHTDILLSAGQLLEAREARVQAIKKSIAAGTYIIYPYKIAGKILKWM